MEISQFPKILGELSMHKQCVLGSFFSTHAREPGNKASKACQAKLPSIYLEQHVLNGLHELLCLASLSKWNVKLLSDGLY